MLPLHLAVGLENYTLYKSEINVFIYNISPAAGNWLEISTILSQHFIELISKHLKTRVYVRYHFPITGPIYIIRTGGILEIGGVYSLTSNRFRLALCA